MNRQTLALIPAVLLLVITACQTGKTGNTPTANNNPAPSAATATATPDQFAAARASFEKNCKLCHGANGDGGPVKLEDGTKLKVPTFHEGHALHHPDADYVKQITKGGDGMPAFGEKLKPEEINDLIRFIRHEFQGGMTPPTEPMKPMKGMKGMKME
jgi:cytochrome c551